jgi:hypothetical protein
MRLMALLFDPRSRAPHHMLSWAKLAKIGESIGTHQQVCQLKNPQLLPDL